MAFAKVNGAVVHYADEGRRDARAIVFINSLGMDFRIWDEVARPLGAAYRVVRLRQARAWAFRIARRPRADGGLRRRSGGPARSPGVSGAVIVGVSMGGLIAQELYRLRPDLVAALALCGTAAKIGTEEIVRQRMEAVARGGVEAIADGVMQRWFTRDFRARRFDEFAGWRMMLTRTLKDGYLTACGAMMHADLRPDCAPHRGPDPVRGRRGGRLDAGRDGARTRWAHRAGALRDHRRRRRICSISNRRRRCAP